MGSTPVPGLRPHGFLDWSGCSGSIERLRDETPLALNGPSQHTAGGRFGGEKRPTSLSSSCFGPNPKIHVALAHVVFNGGAKRGIAARPERRELREEKTRAR